MNESILFLGIFEQEIYGKLRAFTCIEWHDSMLDVLHSLEHVYKLVQKIYIIITDNELSFPVLCKILASPKIQKIFVLFDDHKKHIQSDQLNEILKNQVSFHYKRSFDSCLFQSLIDSCSVRSEDKKDKFVTASFLKSWFDSSCEEPVEKDTCEFGLVDTFRSHLTQVFVLSEGIPKAQQNSQSEDSVGSNRHSNIEEHQNINEITDLYIDQLLCMPEEIEFSDQMEVES